MMQMRWSLKPKSTKRQATQAKFTPGAKDKPPMMPVLPPVPPSAPAAEQTFAFGARPTAKCRAPAERVAEQIFTAISSPPHAAISPGPLHSVNAPATHETTDAILGIPAAHVAANAPELPKPATSSPRGQTLAIDALLSLGSRDEDKPRSLHGSRSFSLVPDTTSSAAVPTRRCHSAVPDVSYASHGRESPPLLLDAFATHSSSSDTDAKPHAPSAQRAADARRTPTDVLLRDVVSYDIGSDGTVFLKGQNGGFLGTLSKASPDKASPGEKKDDRPTSASDPSSFPRLSRSSSAAACAAVRCSHGDDDEEEEELLLSRTAGAPKRSRSVSPPGQRAIP